MNKYDDSCTETYSELSQTTEMNLSRNQSMVLLMNYSAKAPSQMLDYAQKTLLIIYNTSSVKFLKIYRVYNYIIFCAD